MMVMNLIGILKYDDLQLQQAQATLFYGGPFRTYRRICKSLSQFGMTG